MKYLRKFNESSEMSIHQWIDENIKYTNDDILYYFSEFTDKYEYEYKFEIHTQNHSEYSILENGYINVDFIFTKPNSKKSNIVEFVKLGEELEEFNIHLQQFINLEEDIKNVKDIVNIGGVNISITVRFERIIPIEVLNKFKEKLHRTRATQKTTRFMIPGYNKISWK